MTHLWRATNLFTLPVLFSSHVCLLHLRTRVWLAFFQYSPSAVAVCTLIKCPLRRISTSHCSIAAGDGFCLFIHQHYTLSSEGAGAIFYTKLCFGLDAKVQMTAWCTLIHHPPPPPPPSNMHIPPSLSLYPPNSLSPWCLHAPLMKEGLCWPSAPFAHLHIWLSPPCGK